MYKYFISIVLRKLGLIRVSDKIRFFIGYIGSSSSRRRFLKENPNVAMPPAYFLYETYNLNYYSFYNNSIDTANWLVSFFKKYKTLEELKVLDWGCGPGRVIRHLPSFMGGACSFYGTDYNENYIKWCRENLPDVTFSLNHLKPPMHYDDDSFDIIYGISIFTHLSKDLHYLWFNELVRVAKKGGILLLTLHGDAFKVKLSNTEKELYEKGEIVIKANTKEGHRTFGAYHPTPFVKELIGNNEILEHVSGRTINGNPQQDIWIIKKV